MADAKTDHTALAMVALSAPMLPNAGRLIRNIGAELGIAHDTTYEESDSNIILPTATGILVIALMDFPIPREAGWGTLADSAWWWPEAEAAMSAHTAHLILHVRDDHATAVEAHRALTLVARELIDQLCAVAITFGSVLTPPNMFAELADQARASDAIPLPLWVLVQMSTGPNDATVVSTLGMSDFGLMELEANPAPMPPERAWSFVGDIGAYLLANGPVIGDGDTIGGSKEERIVVRHAPSFRPDVETVYKIDFGLPDAIDRPKPGTGGTKAAAEQNGFFSRLFRRD